MSWGTASKAARDEQWCDAHNHTHTYTLTVSGPLHRGRRNFTYPSPSWQTDGKMEIIIFWETEMGAEIRRYMKSIVDCMTLPRSNNLSFVWYTALKYHYGCTHTRLSIPSSGPFEPQSRIVCCDLDLSYFIKALYDWDDIVYSFTQRQEMQIWGIWPYLNLTSYKFLQIQL